MGRAYEHYNLLAYEQAGAAAVADEEDEYAAARVKEAAKAATSLTFGGVTIGVDGDKLFLTDMWRAAGSDNSKKPYEWLRQDGTKAFIEYLETMGLAHSLMKTTEGRNGGTWGALAARDGVREVPLPLLPRLVQQRRPSSHARSAGPSCSFLRCSRKQERSSRAGAAAGRGEGLAPSCEENTAVLVAKLESHLRDDEGHVGVHAPRARVVDDDRPRPRGDRRVPGSGGTRAVRVLVELEGAQQLCS